MIVPPPAPPSSDIDAVRRLAGLLDTSSRRRLGMTLCWMLVAAIAEFVTIGAVLPVLALLLGAGTHKLPFALPGYTAADGLFYPVALLTVATIAAGGARLYMLRRVNHLAFAIGSDFGQRIFERTIRQPYLAHVARNPAHVFAGLDKINIVIFNVLLPLMHGVSAVLIAGAIIALLMLVSAPLIIAVTAAVGAVYAVLILVTRRRLRANSQAMAAMANARMKLLQEGVGALPDLQIAGAHALFDKQFRQFDTSFRRAQGENLFLAAAPRPVLEGAGVLIVAALALLLNRQPGGLSAALPALGVLVLGAQRLLPLVNSAYVGWTMFTSNRQALADVIELLDAPIVTTGSDRPLRFEREIVFDAVGHAYPEGGIVLRDINLTLRRGDRVGLMGPTGSGKSTLIALLTGLIQPQHGTIRIDGDPLDADTLRSWQAQIAMVPQSVYLFDASIARNIAFDPTGSTMDRARVEACARAAQLGELIETADGLDMTVGDRGVRLSGGQRQRIAIARALYRQPRLLILDEATAQLDAATEAALLRAIHDLDAGMTVVVIAHQSSALAGCDRIIRLADGRCLEQPSVG